MNAHDTRQLATQLLDALVRDVRTISAAVAGLAQLEGKGNWSNADETALRQHQARVAELVSRYRTGESILTVKPAQQPAPPACGQRLIDPATARRAARVASNPCTRPAGHDGPHSDDCHRSWS